MKSFNVIIYDFNSKKFESYDIMPYLLERWEEFLKKAQFVDEDPEGYWKIPTTFEEYKNWIDRELKYQYWGRCQYELVLSPWPPKENEEGEMILEENTAEKWDIYQQCMMNIDIISQIFIEIVNGLV